MPTIDIEKVKAAVEKYKPRLQEIRRNTKGNIPVDAGRRKIIRTLGTSCTGFGHFNK